jgi:hypothetical protein
MNCIARPTLPLATLYNLLPFKKFLKVTCAPLVYCSPSLRCTALGYFFHH